MYANDAVNQSLGLASVTSGVIGKEVVQYFHVVEGGAPFLLSAKLFFLRLGLGVAKPEES